MDITVKLVLSEKIYVCHSRNLEAGIQKKDRNRNSEKLLCLHISALQVLNALFSFYDYYSSTQERPVCIPTRIVGTRQIN
jgi:hypothetical protein